MSDWVHIEPPAPCLTPVQERIREMLRAGKTFRQICVALMMRSDYLRDEIFYIRKWESVTMPGKKLTPEQREKIEELKSLGMSQRAIAKEMGVSQGAVSIVLNAARMRERYRQQKAEQESQAETIAEPLTEPHPELKPEKKTGINPEFDAAVNDMIAEAKEPEFTNEDTIVDTLDTIEDTKPEVPDAVMDAVRDKIDELQKQVDERAAEIALLNEKICSLNAWLSEVQT